MNIMDPKRDITSKKDIKKGKNFNSKQFLILFDEFPIQ